MVAVETQIGVVAHTSRLAQAEALADTVNAALVSVDDGTRGCEGNHRNVWQWMLHRDTDWMVVLEDDAQPIAGFTTQLGQALTHAPTGIVSLYLGRLRPPWAQQAIQTGIAELGDAHWLLSNHLLHAVGYAIHHTLLESLIHHPDSRAPIDQHISLWAPQQVAYCYPSLLGHSDGPTVVNHPDGEPRPPGRVAWKTAAHHNWSNRSVTLRI